MGRSWASPSFPAEARAPLYRALSLSRDLVYVTACRHLGLWLNSKVPRTEAPSVLRRAWQGVFQLLRSCRVPVVSGLRVTGSEGRTRVASLPGSKMDGRGNGGGNTGGARGAPLAFLGASGMVAESRGFLPPSGKEASWRRCRGRPPRRPAAAQLCLSSHSQAARARGPRRHGRGSRGAAAAAAARGGSQQGEALCTCRL